MKYKINKTAMVKGFITNLGKYNEGELVGKWISFPISDEELEMVFAEIGINEEYEETFFTDWDCEIDCDFGEYENIEHVNELAEQLEDLDEWDIDIVNTYMECICNDLEQALEEKDDCTFYADVTLEELAEQLAEECGDLDNVPDFIRYHIDWEGIASELEMDGYSEVTGGVFVYQ